VRLDEIWRKSTANEWPFRSQWVAAGARWDWSHGEARHWGRGYEWSTLTWPGSFRDLVGEERNFAIEATIAGRAAGAGFSFGDFKDFLADPGHSSGRRRLRLELDSDTRLWTFYADGHVMDRRWWDARAATIDDLLDGPFSLKVHHGGEVAFSNVTLAASDPVCHISVIVTCYRFANRLRVTLRNWNQQDLPAGAYEVLIAGPEGPEGPGEQISETPLHRAHIKRIPVAPELAVNKGLMINRAFEQSRGRWIWLTDADCLFSSSAARQTLEFIRSSPDCLYYGERWNLPQHWTNAALNGKVDGLAEFAELSRVAKTSGPDVGPYGFTQIVHRSVFNRIRYREDVNHFAHTDDQFAANCRRIGLRQERVQGLYCLHLVHPFAWYGTNHSL
jgi:hypothetical protein